MYQPLLSCSICLSSRDISNEIEIMEPAGQNPYILLIPFSLHTQPGSRPFPPHLQADWDSEPFPSFPLQLRIAVQDHCYLKRIQFHSVANMCPRSAQVWLLSGQNKPKLLMELFPRPAVQCVCQVQEQCSGVRLLLSRPVFSQKNFYQQIRLRGIRLIGCVQPRPLLHSGLISQQLINCQKANIRNHRLVRSAIKSKHFDKATSLIGQAQRYKEALRNYDPKLLDKSLHLDRITTLLNSSVQSPQKKLRSFSSAKEVQSPQRSPIELFRYEGEQSLLRTRQLCLFDQPKPQGKTKVVRLLIQKTALKKQLSQLQWAMTLQIVLKSLELHDFTLTDTALQLFNQLIPKLLLSRFRPIFSSVLDQITRAVMLKMLEQRSRERAASVLRNIFKDEFDSMVSMLQEMMDQADQSQLFQVANLAIVLREMIGFDQLILAPLKLKLIGHPSRKLRQQVNQLFNNGFSKTCQFCGSNSQLFVNQEDFILHLKNHCKMLALCYTCGNLVEVQEMHQHLRDHNIQSQEGRCFYCGEKGLQDRWSWLRHLQSCKDITRE